MSELTTLQSNGDIAACHDSDALIRALKLCASDILKNLSRMAAILRRLDELGVTVEIDNALLPYVRMIANGSLTAECFLACSGDPKLLDLATNLSPDLQKRIAANEPFKVLEADGKSRMVSALDMNGRQLSQVFTRDGERSDAEQLRFIEKRTRAISPVARTDATEARHKEDLVLIERAQSGDAEAKSELIARYDDMLHKFAKSGPNRDNDREDYYQKAVVYFLGAIDRFDPSFGVTVSTYAYSTVRRQLWNENKKDGLIRHPFSPEAQELKRSRGFASIHDKDDGKPLVQVADEDALADQASALCDRSVIEDAMRFLAPNEKQIFRLHLEGKDLQAIGDEIGISRERVRQIKESAMARIQHSPEIKSRRREAFASHIDWLIEYVEENGSRLNREEIEKLTALSMKIDDLTEAAA